ncbi:TRAP transporter small permease [Moorella sulfitireducens]|uniref:TRAP transporter small permease n=1 Tax=Neomoorella sulfitireducens TaxID=2972948 RepID=UPI0021AC51F7|nr:TRAP transporter small permease [Moorella sulfitireducens]
MKLLEKIAHFIINALSYMSIFIVVAMMLLVVSDVILRIVFKSPLVGATEITQMMLVGMLLAFGRSCLGDDNLKVDFVMNYCPRKVRLVFRIITSLISIGMCILIAWRSFETALYSKGYNIHYLMLKNVPQWPFIILLVIGFLGGCFGLGLLIARYVHQLRTPEEDGETPAETLRRFE